jgi:hypothetical protein
VLDEVSFIGQNAKTLSLCSALNVVIDCESVVAEAAKDWIQTHELCLWEYSMEHHKTPAKIAVRVGLPTYTAQEVLDVRIDWDIGK